MNPENENLKNPHLPKLVFESFSKHSIKIIHLLFIFNLAAVGQLRDYINKNTVQPAGRTTDSAKKAIIIEPGTQITSSSQLIYDTKVIDEKIFVEWPVKNLIVQRNNSNSTWVHVRGTCKNLNVDSVKIRANANLGGVTATKRLKVTNGAFEGAIQLTGGDYVFEISEHTLNGVPMVDGFVNRIPGVGVGEVIIIWGHSFMQGDGISGTTATESRSRTVLNVRNDPSYQNFYFENPHLLPYTFEKIRSNNLGPFNEDSWMWASFADTLVKRLNVPVMIFGVAFGGSNIYENRQNILNLPFGFDWFGDPNPSTSLQLRGFPYKTVSTLFNRYIPKTGARCILVEHGSNDNSNAVNGGDVNNFYNNFSFVINHIRTSYSVLYNNLAFAISYEDQNFTAINNQIGAIKSNLPNIHNGIDLRDTATRGSWRDEGGTGHFIGQPGRAKYLELWKNAVNSSLFTNTSPVESSVRDALKQ